MYNCVKLNYFRCCLPWQSLSEDKCMMTKTRDKTNLTMSTVINKPDCKASLLLPREFSLGEGGRLTLTGEEGREVERGRYCLDRGSARLCQDRQEYR